MPNVLITGGGKRLGRHFALEFARRGWDVGITYLTSAEGAENTRGEIGALGRKAIAVRADALSKEETGAAFRQIFDTLGRVDVLVSNAGVMPPRTAFQDISGELFDEAFGINVRSGLYAAQIFSGLRKEFSEGEKFLHGEKLPHGRIIQIASLGGREIWRERIPYNVSKAAAIQLGKALARELAPGYSVNTVCPGAILVPGEGNANEKQMMPAEKIPMRGYGSPADVFDAVFFFAVCSPYITAQCITVDGGLHDAR